VDRWLRRLVTIGFSRGTRGSRPWLVTGIVALGLRALRRLANPPEKVLLRTPVKVGDSFVVTARPRPTARERRRAGK
jgi:hypothetical protein